MRRLWSTTGGPTSGEPRTGEPGAATKIEDWQILAPVRGHAHGVRDLNRFLQRQFRADDARMGQVADTARSRKPLGPEEILWGDKVISVSTRAGARCSPEGALRYIANGDIGVVVGQYKTQGIKGPVEGRGRVRRAGGFVYEYRASHFGEKGSPPLELAYALTVHKAQGSEFGRTIVVIPNPCRILTRELLYTALTRQTRAGHGPLPGRPGGPQAVRRAEPLGNCRQG